MFYYVFTTFVNVSFPGAILPPPPKLSMKQGWMHSLVVIHQRRHYHSVVISLGTLSDVPVIQHGKRLSQEPPVSKFQDNLDSTNFDHSPIRQRLSDIIGRDHCYIFLLVELGRDFSKQYNDDFFLFHNDEFILHYNEEFY